jgi:hypothetical protein
MTVQQLEAELEALRLECQRLRDENSRLYNLIAVSGSIGMEDDEKAVLPSVEELPTDEIPHDMVRLTRDMLHAGKTGGGGFNRRQIEALGLRYPPMKGWLSRLIGKTITRERYERYLALNTEARVAAGEIKPRKYTRRKSAPDTQ